MQYCAINVALYGKGGKRWAMTERSAAAVSRATTHFEVGPSALTWDNGVMTIDIDEITVPIPTRIRGRIRVTPRALTTTALHLDAEGAHTWWPIAPISDVEVDLQSPARTWRGAGYLDSNWGTRPLEASFSTWNWSRARHGDDAVIYYDVMRRHGPPLDVALRFNAHGDAEPIDAPPIIALPTSGWRVPRATRTDSGSGARIVASLEDTPFYNRAIVDTNLLGRPMRAVHEGLSLDRFASPWVQMLLPFKMPRVRR